MPGEEEEVRTGQVEKTAGTKLWPSGRVGTLHSTLGHALWLGQRLGARKGAGDEREVERDLREDCERP